MEVASPKGEIRTEVKGAIGCLIISNPRKRNAMTKDMWGAFASGIAALDSDAGVRVIVVQGDGDIAFVSGADISQFEGQRASAQDQAEYDAIAANAYDAPGRASKPVIAAIRGICIGGGLGLAAACDLRVCSTDARFRMPAARLGLGYSVEGVQRFVGLVGPQNALDLFMTAREFGAEEALRMGFVAATETADRLHSKVAEMASVIAENAPLTLHSVKLAVRAACSRDEEVMAAARRAVLVCGASADHLEGQRAFREKRQPRFTGK